jgi:hypothetical protein
MRLDIPTASAPGGILYSCGQTSPLRKYSKKYSIMSFSNRLRCGVSIPVEGATSLSINQIAHTTECESFHHRLFEKIVGKAELDLAGCIERMNLLG